MLKHLLHNTNDTCTKSQSHFDVAVFLQASIAYHTLMYKPESNLHLQIKATTVYTSSSTNTITKLKRED